MSGLVNYTAIACGMVTWCKRVADPRTRLGSLHPLNTSGVALPDICYTRAFSKNRRLLEMALQNTEKLPNNSVLLLLRTRCLCSRTGSAPKVKRRTNTPFDLYSRNTFKAACDLTCPLIDGNRQQKPERWNMTVLQPQTKEGQPA